MESALTVIGADTLIVPLEIALQCPLNTLQYMNLPSSLLPMLRLVLLARRSLAVFADSGPMMVRAAMVAPASSSMTLRVRDAVLRLLLLQKTLTTVEHRLESRHRHLNVNI